MTVDLFLNMFKRDSPGGFQRAEAPAPGVGNRGLRGDFGGLWGTSGGRAGRAVNRQPHGRRPATGTGSAGFARIATGRRRAPVGDEHRSAGADPRRHLSDLLRRILVTPEEN